MGILVRPADDAGQVAAFIASLNRYREHHIGYCGEEREQIRHTLEQDFGDAGIAQSFFLAVDGDVIAGALGFDIDHEAASAEVWGPFVREGLSYMDVAGQLWRQSVPAIGDRVHTFLFFVNEENIRASTFISSLGGVHQGRHVILQATGGPALPADHLAVPFSPRYGAAFQQLHDRTFPGTYLTGAGILAMLDARHRLFIIPDGESGVKGYVFTSADPLHREGSIEFLAVDGAHRGQGLATRLLQTGLRNLFRDGTIAEVRLTVSAENRAAIRLYLGAGFRVLHRMNAFRLGPAQDRAAEAVPAGRNQ